jgi:hypothetical protein
MKRVTYEVLKSLESRIQKFWEEFVLSPAYEYYSVAFFFPRGHSSIRKLEEGMTGRECYYWMQGFLSAYYKIKEGEIAPPRLAPKGKKLWVVNHEHDVPGDWWGVINIVYAPDSWTQGDVEQFLCPDKEKAFNWIAIEIEQDKIWTLNSPIDTQGEQDAI